MLLDYVFFYVPISRQFVLFFCLVPALAVIADEAIAANKVILFYV